MATKDVILEGTRWNIGNGAKVQIWKDKWMPCIDQELHAWKADAIHHTFLPHEAQVILGILLSSLPTEDRLV